MKDIIIDNKLFQYKCLCWIDSTDSYGMEWTQFYYGIKQIIYRKYLLFGKKIIKEMPKEAFTIPMNIEDKTKSKEDIKKIIMTYYCLWNPETLKKREEEIEQGIII